VITREHPNRPRSPPNPLPHDAAAHSADAQLIGDLQC
jgi:hypothetical protein